MKQLVIMACALSLLIAFLWLLKRDRLTIPKLIVGYLTFYIVVGLVILHGLPWMRIALMSR